MNSKAKETKWYLYRCGNGCQDGTFALPESEHNRIYRSSSYNALSTCCSDVDAEYTGQCFESKGVVRLER